MKEPLSKIMIKLEKHVSVIFPQQNVLKCRDRSLGHNIGNF